MELICTHRMDYGTRRLLPGDIFVADSERDAKVLIAIRKAKEVVKRADVEPPPDNVIDGDLTALRAEAEALGVRVDKRWGESRLRAEIQAANND